MLNIALCDDEEEGRKVLKEWLRCFQKEKGFSFLIEEYASGMELFKCYGKQYDLIFMDIEMRGMDGIETAKRIRKIDLEVAIFFSTGHSEYAYDSFSVEPAGYILKKEKFPVFSERLQKAIYKIVSRKKGILISYQGEDKYIEVGKVLYMEYYKHCVSIRLIDGTFEKAKNSFKEMLQKDKEGVLIQINRNTAVNILWIEECLHGIIKLKTLSKNFEIARRKRKYTEEIYYEHCIRSAL